MESINARLREVYTGDLNGQLEEAFYMMQDHMSKLQYFYTQGANYILKTWEKFVETDEMTALMISMYNSLYGGSE